LVCIKPVLYSPGANLSLPDKLQRTPLKPSMQPYVQFPSRGSHILPTHVSQRCSQLTPIVLNATFSNIAAISWQPVLVVGKPAYPERTTDHGQATGKLYHLR
jgi:hypothetical protein